MSNGARQDAAVVGSGILIRDSGFTQVPQVYVRGPIEEAWLLRVLNVWAVSADGRSRRAHMRSYSPFVMVKVNRLVNPVISRLPLAHAFV